MLTVDYFSRFHCSVDSQRFLKTTGTRLRIKEFLSAVTRENNDAKSRITKITISKYRDININKMSILM